MMKYAGHCLVDVMALSRNGEGYCFYILNFQFYIFLGGSITVPHCLHVRKSALE